MPQLPSDDVLRKLESDLYSEDWPPRTKDDGVKWLFTWLYTNHPGYKAAIDDAVDAIVDAVKQFGDITCDSMDTLRKEHPDWFKE